LEPKANYTVVGLVVLILITALLATALWLSVGFEQKKHNIYMVYLSEAATGVSSESAVKYNGVQVGHVQKIKLNKRDPQQVILYLAIEEGTPITTSTYATLVSQGITGVTYVGLSAEDSDLTPLKKEPGEPYPVIPSKPSLFHHLDKVLNEVSDNINKVSIEIRRIFDRENADNMKKTLANVEKFSYTLSKNSDNFNAMLKSSSVFMRNLEDVSRDFPEIMKDLKISVRKINGMATDVSSAGQDVSSAMKAGKSTMDQISQETIPSADTLLRKLDRIAANFEVISSQMRQNPSVIIRGTTHPKLGPGEKR